MLFIDHDEHTRLVNEDVSCECNRFYELSIFPFKGSLHYYDHKLRTDCSITLHYIIV